MPASLEPSLGLRRVSCAAVPWPTGAQAHSGCSRVGLRLRVEVHRAHPQPELHRRDRLADRLELARPGSAARTSSRACRPSAARGTAGESGCQSPGDRLPAVVEDEGVDAEPACDRGDLAHRGDVHVVLGAGRDPVGVGAVRVEGDVVRVGHEPVAGEVAVELPRLVAVAARRAPVKAGSSAQRRARAPPRASGRPGRSAGFSTWPSSSSGPRPITSRLKSDDRAARARRRRRRATRAGRCAPSPGRPSGRRRRARSTAPGPRAAGPLRPSATRARCRRAGRRPGSAGPVQSGSRQSAPARSA